MRQSLINKLNSNNMSEKKVIEQDGVKNVTVEQETTRDLFIDIQGGVTVISSIEKKPKVLIIEPKNRTTVAKAICPEYQKVEDERDELLASNEVLSNEALKYDSLKQHCEIISTELNWEREVVVKDLEQKNAALIDQNVNLQSDLSAWENRAKEAEQRNAKLVEALEEVKKIGGFDSTGKIGRTINQALQNNKKIEGL